MNSTLKKGDTVLLNERAGHRYSGREATVLNVYHSHRTAYLRVNGVVGHPTFYFYKMSKIVPKPKWNTL